MTPAPSTWSFMPGIDPALIGLLALALLAPAVREVLRARSAAAAGRFAIRAASITSICLLLGGPGRWTTLVDSVRPEVVLLVDRSRSMSVHDGDAGCPRLASMQQSWLTESNRARLAAAATTTLYAVADTTEPLPAGDIESLQPSGSRSRLAAGIAALVSAGRAPAGARSLDLVLLSDGIDTEGSPLGSLASAAKSAGARIHAVVPSGGAGPGDTSLDASFDRPWIVAGEDATLRLDIAESGYAGASARLTVRERSGEGPIVAERTVTLGPRQTVEMKLHPAAEQANGSVTLARYAATLEPQPGEALAANNLDSAFVQILPKRLRVVLFEGEPSWDTRSFSDALAAEPEIELTTVYRLEPPAAAAGGPRFRVTRITPGLERIRRTIDADAPLTADALDAFDVFVFGRRAGVILSADSIAHIRMLVEDRGRSALLLRGPDAPPSPLDWASPFLGIAEIQTLLWPTLRATDLESALPPTRIAELRCTLGALRLAATSVVVADRGPADEPAPIFIEMRVGSGRIGALAAEGIWRAGVSGDAGRAAARRLWAGWVRRLAYGSDVPPGAPAYLALNTLEAVPGEPITAVVRTRRESLDLTRVPLTIRRPDGVELDAPLTREPGTSAKWTTTFRMESEGDHFVQLRLPMESADTPATTTESMFTVKERDAEMLETTPRRADLESLTEPTGGRVWAPTAADADAFVDELARRAVARQAPPRFEPLWDRPWVLAIVFGLLTSEWWLRRRGGLA